MKTARQRWSQLAQIFSEWKMFQTKVVEEVKTHNLCSTTFFGKSFLLWDNVENTVEWVRPQIAIWRMCIACSVPKATNTHSEYVIFIAFPQQQWLHERTTLAVSDPRGLNALIIWQQQGSTNSLQAPALPTLWRPAVTHIIAYMKTFRSSQGRALA